MSQKKQIEATPSPIEGAVEAMLREEFRKEWEEFSKSSQKRQISAPIASSFFSDDAIESAFEGDLLEVYAEMKKKRGKREAILYVCSEYMDAYSNALHAIGNRISASLDAINGDLHAMLDSVKEAN